MTTAYPLHWPAGFPRNKQPSKAKFRSTLPQSVNNVMSEIRLFGKDSGKDVTNVVVSSNVTLTSPRPADAGIAVYFRWDNMDCCIAVDRYTFTEDNLQAVARIIEADRVKLRHGGLNIVRAAFRGYVALPPPKDASGQLSPPWRHALGCKDNCTLADAEAAYRMLVKRHHPDTGGDAAKFNQITDAIRQAREELKS